ncbi:MAG: hypothetical protein QM778_17945 [Myxococcales bacterium]
MRLLALVLVGVLIGCSDDPVQRTPAGGGHRDDSEDEDAGDSGDGDGDDDDDDDDDDLPRRDGGGDGDGDAPGDGGAGSDSGIGLEIEGCDGAKLLSVSDDTAQRGPWKAGVRTVMIDGLVTEVIYPAKPGSTAGKEVATYDIRDWLPEPERKKIPDAHVPQVTAVGGGVYRDVPIDDAHGPYPVVIFIHGTSSFRVASGTLAVQWASHGFVVVAADYPGLGLKDQLGVTLECGYGGDPQDIPRDVNKQLAALEHASGDLAFLAAHLDMKRIAISGHSQGGCVSSTFTTLPNVKVVMPLSGSTAITDSDSLESVMFVGGMDDRVIGYYGPWVGNVVCPLGSISTQAAYATSGGPPRYKKRLLGLKGGGHLAVTDLCQKNAQGKNAIEEAQADGVCGIGSAVIIGLPYLFDCGSLEMKSGLDATNYATTAVLEETLHCKNRDTTFAKLKERLPQVGEFAEAVK